MNKKVLIALLLIPVLAFSTSKVVKSINKSNNQLKVYNNHSENFAPSIKVENEEEVLKELKASINNIDVRRKAYKSEKRVQLWQKEINEEDKLFIEKNLIKKIEKENICGINLRSDMFSRCPSGYNASLILVDGKVSNTGWICADRGCMNDPIAKFQYNVKEKSIKVNVSEKLGYIDLDDYCRLYKKARTENSSQVGKKV